MKIFIAAVANFSSLLIPLYLNIAPELQALSPNSYIQNPVVTATSTYMSYMVMVIIIINHNQQHF